jgi:hypothetical protein
MGKNVGESIREWAALRFPEHAVLSLFLNLRPAAYRKVPGLVYLKKELSLLQKSVSPRSRTAKGLSQDIRRLEKAVEEARRQRATSLAVFCSSEYRFFEKQVWSIAPESEPNIPNSFVRDFRFNLHPLTLMADRLENFVLIVVDLKGSEIIRVEGGMAVERREKEFEKHPEERREKRGLFDRRTGAYRPTHTNKVGRHEWLHVEKSLWETAKTAVGRINSSGARTMIIGADEVTGPPLRDEIIRLSPRLETVLASIDAKLSQSKKLALGIRAFRHREREISHGRVEELFSPGRRQAVLGAVPVLNFLRESRRGAVLVLDEAFHQNVPICAGCSTVATVEGACPVCSGPVRTTAIENELVCLAAAASAELEFVKDSEKLERAGGAGLLT